MTYGIPVTGDEDQLVGRVDWVQNSKHTLYGRYLFDDYSNPPTFNGTNLLTTTAPGNFERAQSATIGDTYTFGPTTLNSFHVSFNRVRDNRGPTDIPINPTMLGSDMYSAVPNFLLLTINNAFSTFCGTCAPGHFNVNSYQLADDVDLVRGRHQIAAGFNLIRVQNNTISGFDENGTFTFNGSFTGSPLADFMIGIASDFQQTNPTPDDLRQWVMSFYAQDSFRDLLALRSTSGSVGNRRSPTRISTAAAIPSVRRHSWRARSAQCILPRRPACSSKAMPAFPRPCGMAASVLPKTDPFVLV